MVDREELYPVGMHEPWRQRSEHSQPGQYSAGIKQKKEFIYFFLVLVFHSCSNETTLRHRRRTCWCERVSESESEPFRVHTNKDKNFIRLAIANVTIEELN